MIAIEQSVLLKTPASRVKNAHGGNMKALREIIRTYTKDYHLTLPEWAIGRDVEVIVLPAATTTGSVENARMEQQKNMGPLSVLSQ